MAEIRIELESHNSPSYSLSIGPCSLSSILNEPALTLNCAVNKKVKERDFFVVVFFMSKPPFNQKSSCDFW